LGLTKLSMQTVRNIHELHLAKGTPGIKMDSLCFRCGIQHSGLPPDSGATGWRERTVQSIYNALTFICST
jgi:hypothetical protein